MNAIIWLTAVIITLLLLFLWWQWVKLERVTVVTITDFPSEHLGNKRPIYIFLPPKPPASSPSGYKTLYVNDGQDKEQLQLRRTLARFFADGRIEPIVVVAIPTNDERLQEYGTAVAPNAQGLGSKAGAYGRFVTEALMPMIEARFEVAKGAENRAVLGASLGGLSAFDLAWNYPHLFGTVGVFSGSFWWRAGAEETAVSPNQLIAHEMARQGPHRPGFRAWFEAGTRDEKDDRDNNGVIDAIQDTLELVDALADLGYERGQDLVYVEVENGRHNYDTWAKILPEFLLWAYG